MTNRADSDQTAPLAVSSGSTQFALAYLFRVSTALQTCSYMIFNENIYLQISITRECPAKYLIHDMFRLYKNINYTVLYNYSEGNWIHLVKFC